MILDYYDYGLTSGETAGIAAIGGILIVILIVCSVIAITFAVLAVIGQWKMFEKSNQPGWAAIVPIYNTYCLCKLAGINPWWALIATLAPSVLSLIPAVGTLVGSAITIYFLVIISVSIARSFGKSDSYAFGIALLSPIFYFLLGREKEVYVGPRPMHDIVFDDWLKQNQNNAGNSVPEANVSVTNGQSRFCSSCGTKVEGDTKFCPGCGKEV